MAIQQKDRIYLNGELFELLSTPLKTFFEGQPDIPAFSGKVAECRRGYMASWRIRNNVLYLTGFQQVSPTVEIGMMEHFGFPLVLICRMRMETMTLIKRSFIFMSREALFTPTKLYKRTMFLLKTQKRIMFYKRVFPSF